MRGGVCFLLSCSDVTSLEHNTSSLARCMLCTTHALFNLYAPASEIMRTQKVSSIIRRLNMWANRVALPRLSHLLSKPSQMTQTVVLSSVTTQSGPLRSPKVPKSPQILQIHFPAQTSLSCINSTLADTTTPLCRLDGRHSLPGVMCDSFASGSSGQWPPEWRPSLPPHPMPAAS